MTSSEEAFILPFIFSSGVVLRTTNTKNCEQGEGVVLGI